MQISSSEFLLAYVKIGVVLIQVLMWQKPTAENLGHSCQDNNNSHSIYDFGNIIMWIKYFENIIEIESYQEIN